MGVLKEMDILHPNTSNMPKVILQEKDFEVKNWAKLYEFLMHCKEDRIDVISPIVPHLFSRYVQAKVYTRLDAREIVDIESSEYGLFHLSVINYAPPAPFALFKD